MKCKEIIKNKQIQKKKKIWIVASPNVKENFKTQLFDHRKLKKINGVWNLRACTGNTYLNEINPMNIQNLSKELIIREVTKIIKNAYNFIGYTEFSNLIEKILALTKNENKQKQMLKDKFSDSLIVIDEVHNIRHSSDNPKKHIAINLLKVVKNTINLKLLFLSATPMYNNSEEIVWLLNIMNINDKRPPVEKEDIFKKDGSFDKEVLISKSIGYISYVRGENPYTFPYRIWPAVFNKRYSLIALKKKQKRQQPSIRRFYPYKQINGRDILNVIQHLDLFITMLDKYQATGYKAVIDKIKKKITKVTTAKTGLGYEVMGDAIQALNFIYPYEMPITKIPQLYGKEGLKSVMKFNKKKRNFSYRANIVKKYGRIFSQQQIHKHSAKIASFTKTIKKSEGIILIYSRYLDGGCIPIALALEEMGITRFGRPSLFKTPPHPQVSYDTLNPQKGETPFIAAKYALISGDINLSPQKNKIEMKAITDEKNINGEIIKIVIITKAGAEGLDFKNIRQVHILEPWYNLNRVEQVIGRAVRNCSHKKLPYKKRNVEIYLYGTIIDKKNQEEAADLYIYRKAEEKSKKIGEISRILKENAVDCILNRHYNNLSINKIEKQQLSSRSGRAEVDFNIRNKPYSSLCDYMKECKYTCSPYKDITDADINDDTYNETFIIMNIDKIIHRIQSLMKEQFIYKKEDFIARIRANKKYSIMQINSALTQLINDKNQYVTDMFGRLGHLINIDEYYMFQPLEINDEHIDRYERSHPITEKSSEIVIKISPITPAKALGNIIEKIQQLYNCATKNQSCNNEWATQMFEVLQILKNPPFNIPELTLKTFIVEHIFDSLSFHNKLVILNYIWNEKKLVGTYRFIKNVIIQKFILKGGKELMIPVIDTGTSTKKISKTMYILKDKWVVPTREDLVKGKYKGIIEERYKKTNLNQICGFMGTDKMGNIKFKILNRKQGAKRHHKGYQCITQQKNKTQNLLNKLMAERVIDEWEHIQFTLTESKNDNHIAIQRGFSRGKLCSLSEMILRWYNKKDNERTWFLSSFGSLYNKIEK